MRRRRGADRFGFALLLAACALTAATALSWVAGRGGVDAGGAENVDRLGALAREASGIAAGDSSPGRFLDDLAATPHGDDAAVAWSSAGGLVEAASEVLEAYRDRGGTSVMASGYLDLRGRAWGALVGDGSGWVDVVTVMGDEEDAHGEVRVARLRAMAS